MAAQDAELKLKVSLDLAFFRQQLSTIGAQLGGQALQLNVKFDKKSIADQYRLLGTYLSRKTFKVKIESNTLDTLVEKVAKFKKNLQELEKEGIKLNVDIESKTKGQDAAEARRSLIASITGPKGAVFIPIEVKPPLVKNINAIRKDIKERLSGIVVEVEAKLKGGAQIQSAGVKAGEAAKRPSFIDSPAYQAELQKIAKANAQTLAKAAASLPSGRNRQEAERLLKELEAQSLSKEKRSSTLASIRDFIARARYQQGMGFEARLEPIRGQRGTSAPRSMPNLNQMLDRIANLTENPRAAQRMLRMMPESRLTTDLIGAANRQAAFREQFPQGFRMPGFSGAKAFDPLLKAIAKDFSDYAKTVNISDPWVGKIGNGIRDVVARAAQSLQGGGRKQLALPAAGQSSASRMMRSAFSGLPAIMAPQIGGENAPLSRAASYMLNKARRALELPIGPSSPYAPSPFAGAATVPRGLPRSYFQPGRGPQLPGLPLQLALPPAGTTSNYGGGGFGGTSQGGGGGGGGTGRGGALAFPGGNMGPSSPLPKNYLEIGKAIKSLDPILQKSTVPFSGAIRELGEEFGFALKQVLLFGTAYKALAFFVDLPAQALNASKELQSFNNQLNAITGSASNAQRSVQFINDTVTQFNTPLQSAREGFLRLYASMSPAGMEAGTIENLFTGIAQASATLGLSADQVDRVTYAFSQMASKGKVMSEEVTGQLGDVIPGALSLMADAAGMSMADFKQAMEDGQVSGKAMEQLFTNLPIVMQERFGKGAAGAAKTLQGQLNNLATEAKRMYEAFDPLVTSIANQVIPLMSSALKDAQSALEAFGLRIQGINPATSLLSESAQSLYRNFEIVYDTASSVVSIIQSLEGTFKVLGSTLTGALQVINAFIGNPIGEFFVKLAVNIGIATAAINLFIKSGIIAGAQQLLLFVSNIKLTIGALRTLIATSRAAKIAVGGIVAGSIIVGLETLVSYLAEARAETDKLRQSALLAADALSQMSFQQLVSQKRNIEKMISDIEKLQAVAGGSMRIPRPTKEQEALAQQLGLPITGRAGQRAISMVRAEGLKQQLQEQLPQIRYAMDQKFNTPSAAASITPINLDQGEGTQKAGRALSIDELLGGQIKRELDARRKNLERALQRELNRVAGFDNAEQAERMVRTAAELLDIRYQIDAIDKTIAAREQVRSRIIASSTDKARTALAFDEQTNDLKAKRSELETDIEIAILKQRGTAEKQAREDAAALSDKIEKQKQLNRLIEDARIAAGIIPPRQAAIIQQQRGFEDARARVQAEGTPEQLAQLTAVQALIPQAGSIQEYVKGLREELQQLISVQNLAAVSARGIGEALGEAMTNGVASLISGTATAKEVFANFLQSVGQALSQAASQMIATYIAIGIAKMFAGLGGGGGTPSYSGGKVATNAFQSTDALGLGNSISGGGAFFGASAGTFSNPSFSIGAFANGGVVSGPTLGLIGEGKYNEAVVPLPDGKSIPVQMRGGQSSRDLLSNGAQSQSSPSVLSMSFQSTTINGVEYVSRDQLEAAMMETRKLAARDGANRGASLALDRLQNSPNARRRVGI